MDPFGNAVQVNAHGHALRETHPGEYRIDVGKQLACARRIVAIHDPDNSPADADAHEASKALNAVTANDHRIIPLLRNDLGAPEVDSTPFSVFQPIGGDPAP